jgi:hypothetical protein
VWAAPTRSGHFEKSTLKKQLKKGLRLSQVRPFRSFVPARRQSLWPVWSDSGFPAIADAFSRSHRQPSVVGGHCRRAIQPGILDLKSGRVLPGTIAAYSFSETGCKRTCRPARSVDTDMSRGLDIPKASPDSAARAIFDGAEKGEEETFPNPMSESIAEGWRSGAAKALQQQFRAFVPEIATKVA